MTLLNSAVIGKVLTGYVSGSGTVAATDTILQAVNKLNGNDALKAPIASPTFTGVISNALGAVGAPSYTFTGDTNTGMWSSGADTLDFSTAGVNRLSIASTGASTFTAVGDRIQLFTSDDHVTVSLKCLGSTKTSTLRYAQGSTVAYDLAMGTGATPTFSLYSYIGSVGTILSATTAGAWSFGPASAAANYNGQRHYISGGLAASNVTSADGSGTLYIGVNSYKSGYTASSARTDTTSGGMGISLANRTVSTSNGFEMFSSLPGESVSTSSVIASATHEGAWTFPLIHNIGAGNITSGTYTPSIANVANASGITAQVSTYSRVGNIVTVNGVFTFGSTSAGLQTTLTISLPIASNFTLSTDATGVGATDVAGSVNPYLAMQITAKTSSSLVFIYFNAQITSVQTATFTFQYLVK
jgi:hypothetical protein